MFDVRNRRRRIQSIPLVLACKAFERGGSARGVFCNLVWVEEVRRESRSNTVGPMILLKWIDEDPSGRGGSDGGCAKKNVR